MEVGEIMTTEVITVRPTGDIQEVSELINKFRIHAIPVTDEGKIVGIITESDFFVKSLLNAYLPSYIDFIKEIKFADKLSHKQKEDLAILIDAKAADIMTPNCVTVHPDFSIKDLLAMFQKTNFYSIPVVDDKNNLVGIVTLTDLLKHLKINE